eukprot:1890568-Pyramimonas_sp.AAC.1
MVLIEIGLRRSLHVCLACCTSCGRLRPGLSTWLTRRGRVWKWTSSSWYFLGAILDSAGALRACCGLEGMGGVCGRLGALLDGRRPWWSRRLPSFWGKLWGRPGPVLGASRAVLGTRSDLGPSRDTRNDPGT